MKPEQHTKGVAEKKPRASGISLTAPSPTTTVEPARAQAASGSPSEAVWTKYIDSRMRQFLTR